MVECRVLQLGGEGGGTIEWPSRLLLSLSSTSGRKPLSLKSTQLYFKTKSVITPRACTRGKLIGRVAVVFNINIATY